MSEDAIVLENIWKNFPMKRDKPGFKEFLVNARKYFVSSKKVFWALKGIDLKVVKGECLGIIGNNGAGKSTLLALMLGTIFPTKGKLQVFGKKTPLLQLGSGFHPDLTGIENIMINGVLLGLTKAEVMDRVDDIVEFAELGEFIWMPARTYSAGMYMRLAFSVAIHIDPEIMLIDEVLAVGDASFQKKSRNALLKIINGGGTTVLVSHDLEAIKTICSRVVWLDRGKIREDGDPEQVINSYQEVV